MCQQITTVSKITEHFELLHLNSRILKYRNKSHCRIANQTKFLLNTM